MKLRFLTTLAFALVLAGCANKIEQTELAENTIAAIMENDGTRTSVSDEGSFAWTAGDQVWLHTTSGYTIGTLSSGAGSANGTFTYGAIFGELTGKAVYPYNENHAISSDELTVFLPATYDLGSSTENTNAIMFAQMDGGRLKFNHLAGVMRFVFKDVPAGVNQFQLTLDQKINGKFTADLTQEYPTIATVATASESEKTVTLNFDALQSEGDLRLIVPVPMGTYNSLSIKLNNSSENVYTYTSDAVNTINRKSLLLMPVVTLDGNLGGDIEGGEPEIEAVNLSSTATANSYIVTEAGTYKFKAVKGNSEVSVGSVASAVVLWETFGTATAPNEGDLIKASVRCSDGFITFSTNDTYKKGNAVIAAKDSEGTILWSWHIWMTDQPAEQVYNNSAGTMMDRNLGATSATPGDVGALGLMYQWGRKDPFLGASVKNENTKASSTISWPNAETSTSTTGTIQYTISNPTTFISQNSNNYDWYFTGDKSTNEERWGQTKTIYDPCPAGWKVPAGGSDGIWSRAIGSSTAFSGASSNYDSSNKGANFTNELVSSGSVWYPFCGYYNSSGSLTRVGTRFNCWSSTQTKTVTENTFGFTFSWDEYAQVWPSSNSPLSLGLAVRCAKE